MTVGIDATLVPVPGTQTFDMTIDAEGDIASQDSFDAAIVVSLFTDARASESEEWHPEHRRGWIGNEATPGIQIGSKLWLLEQRRLTQTTANDARDFAKAALDWMVGDEHALSVSSTATVTPDGLALRVDITRPNSQVVQRFYDLWDNTGTGDI